MSHALARRAIETKLEVWSQTQGLSVVYGAESFDPPEGQIYLRAFLLPASTTSRYLNSESIEYRGIYQVSIICPAGEPIGSAEAIIDQLSELFPVDSLLSRLGFAGIVSQPADQGPTITEPNTYTVPARFSYWGMAPRVTA